MMRLFTFVIIVMLICIILYLEKLIDNAKNKVRKRLAEPLIKEIKTENFLIEIEYKLQREGKVEATLRTVKSPKGVENIISSHSDGLEPHNMSRRNIVTIKRYSLESLKEDLVWIIFNTKQNIAGVEKSIREFEFSDILSEITEE